MKKKLQILVFFLLSIVIIISLPTLWLGISPDLSFISFISEWEVWGSLGAFFAIYAGIIAYFFGWNPKDKASQWIRERIVLTGSQSFIALISINILLTTILLLEIKFLNQFRSHPNNPVVYATYIENFQAADRELGSIELSNKDIATLYFANESIRQLFYLSSQSADKELCRIYLNYFSKTNLLFTQVWYRNLIIYSQASCMQVLENPKAAIDLYSKSKLYSRWLSVEDERRAARKIAAIHFADKDGIAGISDAKERYRYIISLINADSNETAQRMVGTSYYLLSEFSKAIETWNSLLSSIPIHETLEKKKILNGIALAFSAIHQNTRALSEIEKGLLLPYSVTEEDERREQIRLLSTKTVIELNANLCDSAVNTWNERNALVQQSLSKCSALINAQVLACGGSTVHKQEIIDSLLNGIGQDPNSFIDNTAEALDSIIDQAEKTFKGCYIGLNLNADSLRASIKN